MVSLQKTRLDLAVNALIIVVCYARAASDDGYCQEAVQTAVQVPRCPQNSVEAANAAANKNCEAKAQNQKCTNSSNFVYHCVINVFENATVEVCAPSKFIHGFCTEFNIQGGRIQPHYFRNCSGLKPPCPARYLSTDAYKYKGCYDLIRASNKTDRRKSTGKQTDVNEDKTIVAATASIVPLVTVTILVVIGCCWCKRRKQRKQKCDVDQETVPLTDRETNELQIVRENRADGERISFSNQVDDQQDTNVETVPDIDDAERLESITQSKKVQITCSGPLEEIDKKLKAKNLAELELKNQEYFKLFKMKNTESVDTKSTEKRFKDEMRELQKTGIPKLRELYAASEILEQEVVLILPEFGKILHIWPMLKEITENNPLAIEVLCEEKTPAFRRLDKFCLEDDDWKEFIDLNKDHKRCFDKRFLNDFQVFKSENFYPDLSPLITCERKNFSVSEIVSCFVYGNLFRTQLIEKYVSEHQQDDILKTIYEKLVDYETYIGEDQLQKLGNLQEETEREEYLKTIEAQALAAHLTKRKITSKGDFLSIASIFSIDLYICAGEMKQLIRPICTKINQVFHGHLILFLIPDSESSFTVDCYPSHSCFCKMETPIITGVFSDIQEEILPEINKKINSSSKCCCKPWWPRKSHTHLSHFQKWFHPDIIKNNFRRKKPFVNVRHKNQSEIDKKLLDFLEEDGRTLQQVQSGTICECLAKEVYGTTTVSSTEKIRNTICANDNDNDDTILEKAAETLKTDIFVFKYSLEHSRWVSFHPKERRTRCHFYITLLQIAEEDSLKYNRIIPEEGCNCRHLPPETPYFITKDGIKTDCLTIPREDLECHSHVKILLKDFKTDPQADYFCDEQRRVPLVSFTSEHAIVLSHPEMEDRMIDHISDISFSICKCISKEIFGTEGKFDLILDHLISEIVNNKHLYVRLLEEIQQKTTIDIEMVVNLLKDGVEFEKIELSAAANYYQWPIYTVSLEESNGDCAVKWIEYKPNTEQANEDYYMTFFKASAGYFNRVTCKDANNVCNCRLNKPNETEESQGVNKVWKRRELQQLWGPVNHLVKLKFNFENWIRSNIALEILCLEFVKTLEERRKGTNIASIVGSSTSLIGTILMVSGILASPVTGGATLALTIAGGVISGGGTITTIGAKVAEFARNKKPKSIVRRQQMVLQEHSRRFEKIVKELDKYLKILEEKNREKFTASLDVAPAYLRTFCSIGSIPLLILRVLAKAITSAEAVFIPASVLADGVIIGIAANSLRKGSKTDDSKKLRTAHILLKLTREQMNIWAYGNTYKGGSSNDILKEKAEITTQNEVN